MIAIFFCICTVKNSIFPHYESNMVYIVENLGNIDKAQ